MAAHNCYWYSGHQTKHIITSGLIRNADVLIIGGGVAGIMLLCQLASSGISNCYLVEESSIGSHSSGRSSGQLLLNVAKQFHQLEHGAEYLKFIAENNKLLLAILKGVKFETDLKETGGLKLAQSCEELEALIKEAEFIKAHTGLVCPALTYSDLQVLLPSNKFLGGIFVPTESTFNPYKVVNGLREFTEQNGLRVLTDCCVNGVQRNTDDSFSVSIRHKGTIKAKAIVYCTNAYTTELVPELKNTLLSFRNQMIATESLSDHIIHAFPKMSIVSNNGSEYMRLHNDRLIVGGMRHAVRGQQSGIVDDGEISPVVFDRIRNFIIDFIPTLKNVKLTHTWSNVVCTTPDKMPLVGELPDRKGEYVMCGFGGYGYNHVITSSEIIRDLLLKGSSDFTLFNPGRFNV